MIRKMTQLPILAMFALSLMAFTVMAQKTEKAVTKVTGKKGTIPQLVHTGDLTKRPTLTITEVTKRNAVPNAGIKGQKLVVQVDAKMSVDLPAGARLQKVEWILNTTNSDGSTSQGKKLWNAGNLSGQQTLTCTIDLPMAAGIIAERFTLSATAEIIHEGVAKKISTSKSGLFAK